MGNNCKVRTPKKTIETIGTWWFQARKIGNLMGFIADYG
jgi:hypothetical protein